MTALVYRTRREAAHVAFGTPSVGFDHEARRLDDALGVAVRVAAAGDPDPEPLEPVLKPTLPRPGGAHVLEHAEPALRTEDAPDLGEPASRIRDAAEDQAAHHRVERAVAERQRLGAAADEARARRALPRALERFQGGIETDDSDALAIEGEVPPGPAPHVEREAARALDEPPPPAPKPQPLVERAHRVVEPRDLLEAPHERTLTPLRGLLHWFPVGLRIVQVDAFTDTPFRGNPAAVCVLPAPRDERWMQDVAREMNLSETAFLQAQPDGWSLRWFTPAVEVSLCGHATLASAHVLWEDGHLPCDRQARFHTKSGLLTADRRGDWIELDFPAKSEAPTPAPAGLAEDPVTGSSHCALGPFWGARLGKSELLAYQASARGGVVRVRVVGDRVKLGGQAVTVMRGDLV